MKRHTCWHHMRLEGNPRRNCILGKNPVFAANLPPTANHGTTCLADCSAATVHSPGDGRSKDCVALVDCPGRNGDSPCAGLCGIRIFAPDSFVRVGRRAQSSVIWQGGFYPSKERTSQPSENPEAPESLFTSVPQISR